MRIGVLSDTHGHLDDVMVNHLSQTDEIWHAGDFGKGVADRLQKLALLRGVYGNVDEPRMRTRFREVLTFEVERLIVLMIHIGGYPGHYTTKARDAIRDERPALFISGHSHILKVVPDDANALLHINPGAAGYEGFHQMRTMMTFELVDGKLHELKVIELGPRSTMTREPNILR
jgi:putative phosphoesterase